MIDLTPLTSEIPFTSILCLFTVLHEPIKAVKIWEMVGIIVDIIVINIYFIIYVK